jgi:hypothetical protein
LGAQLSFLLYLDQNYLSGMVKRKPGFRELEPALRAAIARGAVAVPEARRTGSNRPRGPICRCSSFCATSLTGCGCPTGPALPSSSSSVVCA